MMLSLKPHHQHAIRYCHNSSLHSNVSAIKIMAKTYGNPAPTIMLSAIKMITTQFSGTYIKILSVVITINYIPRNNWLEYSLSEIVSVIVFDNKNSRAPERWYTGVIFLFRHIFPAAGKRASIFFFTRFGQLYAILLSIWVNWLFL